MTRFTSLVLALLFAVPALGQDAKKDDGPPKPETIELTTLGTAADPQIKLKGTYFPGTNGKDSVPIVLLHMYGGSRADWGGLAPALQAQGHAVLAMDLRGHGESTTVVGNPKPLNFRNLRPRDFELMVADDMEVVNSWLLGQNNAGKLNIEKFTIIGAEMGAVVAAGFAWRDWSWPPLAGGGKQGQDVKALVLISPEMNFHGLKIDGAFRHPSLQSKISLQLIYGEKDRTAKSAALAMERLAKKYRETEFKTKEEARKNQDLFVDPYPTSLSGTKMLGKGLKYGNATLEQRIAAFIKFRAADQPYEWAERVSPLAKGN